MTSEEVEEAMANEELPADPLPLTVRPAVRHAAAHGWIRATGGARP
jgi:hypothetical protein